MDLYSYLDALPSTPTPRPGPHGTEGLFLSHDAQPYVRSLGSLGQMEFWAIDGSFIRATVDPDFTNFGQHYRFRFIPYWEGWIDIGFDSKELMPFATHLLIEHRDQRHGLTYEQALAHADQAEQLIRRKLSGRILQTNKLSPAELSRKLVLQNLGSYPPGLEHPDYPMIDIDLVDGNRARAVFDDWTEGGHDLRYRFQLPSTVWLDNDMPATERRYVLAHELYERWNMAKGRSYPDAHERSLEVEWLMRHDPIIAAAVSSFLPFLATDQMSALYTDLATPFSLPSELVQLGAGSTTNLAG